jgi:hypothetical protein
MTGDGGDAVTAARQFGKDARSGVAGGSDQGDFHLAAPCGIYSLPAIRSAYRCEEGTFA